MEEVDNIDAGGIEIYPKDKYQLDNKHKMSYYDLEDLIYDLEGRLKDMRTIYGYEELSYEVQQEIKRRVVNTDKYMKYRNEAKHEYVKETLEDFFTDYEVTYNDQIIITNDDLIKSACIALHSAINKVQLLIYSREVNFIMHNDLVLTAGQLAQVTKSANEARAKLIDIINEIRDRIDNHEPDFEQYMQDEWFTEDGRKVTIED